jgi:6-phosphogluconolactonase
VTDFSVRHTLGPSRIFYSGSASPEHRSDLILWQDTEHDGLLQVSRIALSNPSWVVPHPLVPLLYVTQETEPGQVAVIAIAGDGSLDERQRVDSYGALPCHLAIDADATQLAVSNYLDGTVTVWALTPSGAIGERRGVWQLTGNGPVRGRQEQAHAHAAYWRGSELLIVDLGGDSLQVLDSHGALRTAVRLPPGFGPRHLVRVGRKQAVVVGELSGELALVDLSRNRAPVLDVVPTSRFAGAQPSGITRRDNGVVVANRTVGTVSEFVVDGGRLVRTAEVRLPGDHPRAISTVGHRLFVCVQDAGLLVTYATEPIAGPHKAFSAPGVSDFGALPSKVASRITFRR